MIIFARSTEHKITHKRTALDEAKEKPES